MELWFIRRGGVVEGCAGDWIGGHAVGDGVGVAVTVGVWDTQVNFEEVFVEGRSPGEWVQVWESSPSGGELWVFTDTRLSGVGAGFGGYTRRGDGVQGEGQLRTGSGVS